MHGCLIENIPAEQNIYFLFKKRNLEIVFHKFISLIKAHQMDFKNPFAEL